MSPEAPVAVYTDMDDTDPAEGVALLEAAGFSVRILGTRDPEEIVAGAQDAAVLLPGYASVTRSMIERMPKLRIIALMSMGYDYIDVDAAGRHGIWVTNVPGVATQEVAAHALALTLASLRQLGFYERSATPETWNSRSAVAPPRLSELTLGVLGLGKIGQEFARVAGPLFGRVVGHDPLLSSTPQTSSMLEKNGIERMSLQEVRSTAEVLSLHLPLTESTDRLVDASFLSRMRRGSWLVNVSRGALLDSSAVAEALDSGQLSGVAVDVLDEEPPSPGHPLLGRDDVVITPHIAYFSRYTETEYVRTQARNAVAWLRSGKPESAVNVPVTVP